MDAQSVIAVDSRALPWEERFNEKLGRALYRKNLVTDPDTGMEVRLVRYPAGVINVQHRHPCAHGMFVLFISDRTSAFLALAANVMPLRI